MRYFTWKLDWSSGAGFDPTANVNSDVVRIEPQFATGNLEDPNTLIYSVLFKGDLNLAELTNWSIEETTVETMFEAAKIIDSEAILVDGLVKFPITNPFI